MTGRENGHILGKEWVHLFYFVMFLLFVIELYSWFNTVNSVHVLYHYLGCKCLLCCNVHIRNQGIKGRKSIHGTCCVNIELLLQYSTCGPVRLADQLCECILGQPTVLTVAVLHICFLMLLLKSWLRSLLLSPSITVLCKCQWRSVGFYGAQSLHHWEGLQNFFLLLADFSELSLFPSDLICHCVPSSFLYIVVTFSAICEICIPVVTVLFPQSLWSELYDQQRKKTQKLC